MKTSFNNHRSVQGAVALTAALCVWASTALSGQDRMPGDIPPGTITGKIVDARSGEPLRGALVALEPDPSGLLRPAVGASTWSRGVSAQTDTSGVYRFTGIEHGRYRLLVRRLGYRPKTIQLDLTRTRLLRVSVGLTVDPIRLERELGTAPALSTFRPDPSRSNPRGGSRVSAEKARQELHLASDVRSISESDVVEAVTPVEADLFRALQRLPGVTARDEYNAGLWTRGSPWSHTGVYFDGMPLYNPVHTGGVFAAVNSDAIGSAFFHPGSRPASIAGGASGVLNLTSRRWGGDGLDGAAGVSMASARLSAGGHLSDKGSWTFAARRSYVDLLADFVSDSAGQIPYAFLDLTGRVDISLGESASLFSSMLVGRDAVWGTVPDLLRDNEGNWGNAAGQISLTAKWREFLTTHTVGFSRFSGDMTVVEYVADSNTRTVTPNHAPIDNSLSYFVLKSRIEPDAGTASSHWALGYDLEFQRQSFQGPYPRPYPTVETTHTFGNWTESYRAAVWGERRWTFGDLSVQTGIRTEMAGTIANAGAVSIDPRLSARYSLTPWVSVSAGYSQTHQYTQAIAPAGPGIGPDLYLTDVWMLANDTVPAMRSSVTTLGAEAWLGADILASLTLYSRESSGIAIPDPTPGARLIDRSIFVTATNAADGVELSLRRLSGPLTASGSYAFGESEMRSGDLTFPSAFGRRHALDATAAMRLTREFRLGGAFAAASGARFTRVHMGPVGCVSGDLACPDTLFTTVLIEDPGAATAPPYMSMDFFAEWTHEFPSWQISATVQIKNVLRRRNYMTYLGTFTGCTGSSPTSRMIDDSVCDRFHRGLPFLPLVGVSVRF